MLSTGTLTGLESFPCLLLYLFLFVCLSLYISSCYSYARTAVFHGFFYSSVALTLALPYIFTSTHSESNLCVNCNRRLHCCRHRHHHQHDNDNNNDDDVVPVLCLKTNRVNIVAKQAECNLIDF